MQVRDLGLIEYQEALKIQESTRDQIINQTAQDEVLLVCEHHPVITVGRALNSMSEVYDKTIPVFEVTRGGRATLHLPGQVVVYPILNLNRRTKDLHQYMRKLEDAVIETLQDFRIDGARVAGKTGVWCGPRKIASLGIAVKKWVTYHGVALNVICDLKDFSKISPCGFSSDVMTSVEREIKEDFKKVWGLDRSRIFHDVKKRLIENLLEIFEG